MRCGATAVGLLLGVVPSHLLRAEVVPTGGEFQVNTYTIFDQGYSAIASDAEGDFVVVWVGYGQGGKFGVQAQRYDSAGMAAGSEFMVSTYTAGFPSRPAVAADMDGDFVVVWQSFAQDGSYYGVFGRRFDSGGTALGSEFQVNTHTVDRQGQPAVAAAADGDFVVVWNSYPQDGFGYGVFGQRYDSSGVALGSEFQVNTVTLQRQRLPAVAAAPSGDFVVTWQSYLADGSNYGVSGQRYDDAGTAQGGEFRVNTYTPGSQNYARVARDAAGGFVVVWVSYMQDGSIFGVFGQRFDSIGVAKGSEFQVSTYTINSQFIPVVATDAAGHFVVAWRSYQDGDSYGVFAQRFDSSGAPRGFEFQVNVFTTSTQNRADVAAGAADDFVIVWESLFEDGSFQGVFGRRYAEPTATPTATPTDTPTATTTATPTDTATPTQSATQTPTATSAAPMITSDVKPGSDAASGTASPNCAKVQVCTVGGGGTAPSAPPCTSPDGPIGMGTADAGGRFNVALAPPLQEGQCVYAFDTCTMLASAVLCAIGPAPAPALSAVGLALGLGAIVLMALLGFQRARAHREWVP